MTKPQLPRVTETSAGGYVLSNDGSNRVALIARRNRSGRLDWCVPKGHPEGDEDFAAAAVREVFEETGLHAEIIEELGSINYEFTVSNKIIVKTVHHFLMRQTGGTLTVENDPDHEAVDSAWVSVADLESKLTHQNERRLAVVVREWLARAS